MIPDLPGGIKPVKIMRAAGILLLVFTLAATVTCLATGHTAWAVLGAAGALVDGSVVVSQTRFIHDYTTERQR